MFIMVFENLRKRIPHHPQQKRFTNLAGKDSKIGIMSKN